MACLMKVGILDQATDNPSICEVIGQLAFDLPG